MNGYERLDSQRIERLKENQKQLIKKAIKDGGTEGVRLSPRDIEELITDFERENEGNVSQ